MQRIVSLPLSDYASGSRSVTRIIPDDVEAISIELERNSTLNPSFWASEATIVAVTVDLLVGQDWRTLGGFGARGGLVVDATDGESLFSSCSVEIPAGVNRQTRVSVTISGGPCRTRGTLELRP